MTRRELSFVRADGLHRVLIEREGDGRFLVRHSRTDGAYRIGTLTGAGRSWSLELAGRHDVLRARSMRSACEAGLDAALRHRKSI